MTHRVNFILIRAQKNPDFISHMISAGSWGLAHQTEDGNSHSVGRHLLWQLRTQYEVFLTGKELR